MSPNASDALSFSTTLNFKYPKDRDVLWKSGDTWLDDKKIDDGAEGLWRVHDNLYDVTNFIDKHPGGRMWLELTKGTDITEAFESHHLSTTPENVLQKYLVRPAVSPRNSPFTFQDDEFYRTLKRRIMADLAKVPKESVRFSNTMTDLLCIGTFVFAIISVALWSYSVGFISGALLACTTVAAHNYFYRKDNFRMYYFNLSLMQFREWRIVHALSHHLFPNTIIDFEISVLEPLFVYLPRKKSWLVKYGSWIYAIVMWATQFHAAYLKRVFQLVYLRETRQLHWSNAIPFSVPLIMYLIAGQPLLPTLGMWLYIISCGSLWFSAVGFNAAHHHPDIFHDGDTPRSKNKIDWGVHQLDAVAERPEIKGSLFFVLTNFGDHALHHLFPTLDHGALKHLYKTLDNVLEEFGLAVRMKSQLELVRGQFMQLAKEKPNPNPPSCK